MDDSVKNLVAAMEAANSNPDFVGELLADFTRKMMGASVANAPFGAITEATTQFIDILRHLRDFDGIKLRQAMEVTEQSLRVEHQDDSDLRAAQSGLRFLIAKSSNDGFAAARASKAHSTFRADMRYAVNG